MLRDTIKDTNYFTDYIANNLKNVTSILYPPSKETIPILGVLPNQIQNMKTIGFMNILANMTETSYGYTMVGCINKYIDGQISNEDIASTVKGYLGIANLKDVNELLAWSQDIVSLISDGTLNYMGIKPDQAVAYSKGDGKNISLRESSGDSVLQYEKLLSNALNQITLGIVKMSPTEVGVIWNALPENIRNSVNQSDLDYLSSEEKERLNITNLPAGISTSIVYANFHNSTNYPIDQIDGKDVEDNSKENRFATGQCTWYAWGRITELTGTSPSITVGQGDGGKWYDNAENGKGKIAAGSVKAVDANGNVTWNFSKVGSALSTSGGSYGHVAVVEGVEAVYDRNGTLTDYTIYISEANWADGGDNRYTEGKDGTGRSFSANSIAEGTTSCVGFVSFN